MRGNLTVEAALIVPFCIMIILIVCQLGIFQYDREVLKMTGYECILKTVEEGGNLTSNDFCEALKNRAMVAATDRMLGLKSLNAEVKMTSSKIVLVFEGVSTMLEIPMEVSVAYERIYPELTLRIKRAVIGE